jgi:hypothetical protein
MPFSPVRIYFSHAIRGRTGTPEEIENNCRLASAQAAFVRSYLGPGFEIYCPADGDESLQIAWKDGTLSSEQIMEIDRKILMERDIVLAMVGIPSKGVAQEIEWGRFYGLDVWQCASTELLEDLCIDIKMYYTQVDPNEGDL